MLVVSVLYETSGEGGERGVLLSPKLFKSPYFFRGRGVDLTFVQNCPNPKFPFFPWRWGGE